MSEALTELARFRLWFFRISPELQKKGSFYFVRVDSTAIERRARERAKSDGRLKFPEKKCDSRVELDL